MGGSLQRRVTWPRMHWERVAQAPSTSAVPFTDPTSGWPPPRQGRLPRTTRFSGVVLVMDERVGESFAERNDARLPTQYHGLDEPFFEGIAIREAARRFDTLTPGTQPRPAPAEG